MQIMNDAAAGFYWSNPQTADLQAFVRKNRNVPRNDFADRQYYAALHILQKRGETPDGSPPAGTAAQPNAGPVPAPKGGLKIVASSVLNALNGAGAGPAPAAAPSAAPTTLPSLRNKPSGLQPFDKASAEFYWSGAGQAKMQAFVDQNASGTLSSFDERRYWAAVHLLGLDKLPASGGVMAPPPGSGAPAKGGVGQGFVYCICKESLIPGTPPVRQLIVSDAKDVANGHLTDPLPVPLMTALDGAGFHELSECVFEMEDAMSDAQAHQALTGLGLAADPQVYVIATS